ncbi:MAG: hypothetical protein KJ607_03520, partial [Bacteroidetes bacterium]|nr:hypothetical protein [Bacteroidota bacterium]
MKKLLVKSLTLTLVCILTLNAADGQNVAITDDDGYTADPSAMLDVKSVNKGVLLPRLTTAQRNAVINPATGLLVFDTDENIFYFYNGSSWVDVSSSGSSPWSKAGSDVFLADSLNNVGVGTNSPDNKFIVKGDPSSGVDEAIFAVVSPTGDTLFAVSPSGTRVYVLDDGTKAGANRAGFAVGGYSLSKGLTNEYLRVTPDSVRVYINDSAISKASGNKGGFAVGGFSISKGETDSLYLFSDRTGFNVTYLTQTEIDAIQNPRLSSMVFNTSDSCLQIYLGYWENIWCTPLNCVYPSITTQPENSVAGFEDGGTATFSITATGSKIYYKWQESADEGQTWRILSDGGTEPLYSGTYTDTMTLTNVPTSYNHRYYRCFVTNACGTEISGSAVIIAGCGAPYTDPRDYKVYNTTEGFMFSGKCWLAENLNIGTMISSSSAGQLQTDNGTIEKFCYGNDPVECDVYGGLYEWGEMMLYAPSDNGSPGVTTGICPPGWRVPTKNELDDL